MDYPAFIFAVVCLLIFGVPIGLVVGLWYGTRRLGSPTLRQVVRGSAIAVALADKLETGAREALAASGARQVRGVARLADGILACRLADDALLLLGDSTASGHVPARLASLPSDTAVVRAEATSVLAGFCLAGPFMYQFLPKLTPLDPAALPGGSCAETSLGGVPALLVRADELAVPSLRVYVARDLAEYVWGRLLEVGRGLKTPEQSSFPGIARLRPARAHLESLAGRRAP